MKPFLVKNKFTPKGSLTFSGDKSIAHRALLFSALSAGKTIIKNFPHHDDSLSTIRVLNSLGIKISQKNNQVLVFGAGRNGFKKSPKPIFTADSGTTFRLLLGILAGQKFQSKVVAGKYLSLRPMARVTKPLRLMGAKISSRKKGNEEYAPIVIKASKLKGITYSLPVASAQVKSAILLAALFAKGKTTVIENVLSRDHTERMLKIFKADIKINAKKIILNPEKELKTPHEIYVPGDISSAAFFIVLASIINNSKIIIKRLGLNPTRSGIIKVLKRMGAKIKIKKSSRKSFEPEGDLQVSSSRLKATVINSSEVPSLIDEIPILMVCACFANGRTIIKGVGELRVKETDRINSMITNLKMMGADIRSERKNKQENIIINGKGRLYGANLKSFGDHRTAMSMVIASLAAEGRSKIDDISCISKSFPGFLATLKSLS